MTELLKQENMKAPLLALLAVSIVQPVISSVIKGINGRGVRTGEREYMNKYI